MADMAEPQEQDYEERMGQRTGPPLANPSHWKPADLNQQELLYQVWRCLYSIRLILLAWIAVAVISAAVWLVLLHDWTSRSRF